MLTRVLAATVAGGVAFFVLGFVIYGLILDPMVMRPNMNPEMAKFMNEVPHWIPLVLGNLVLALLVAYIFDTWAGIRTFAGGAKGGAIIMFLMAFHIQLMFLAFMRMSDSLTPTIADILGSTVMGAIGGGVIGQVLGMMNKQGSAAATE
jgi:hypothetical protein